MLLPLQGLFMSKNDLINADAQHTVLCFPKVFNICLLVQCGALCNEGGNSRCVPRKKYFRKAGGAVMRVKITLACTECKQRNYNTMKNKKNDPDRLEMNKYCRFCKKHTLHKETK